MDETHFFDKSPQIITRISRKEFYSIYMKLKRVHVNFQIRNFPKYSEVGNFFSKIEILFSWKCPPEMYMGEVSQVAYYQTFCVRRPHEILKVNLHLNCQKRAVKFSLILGYPGRFSSSQKGCY